MANGMQEELKTKNEEYIGKHPELIDIINQFIVSCLHDKPEDVTAYAKKYFMGNQEGDMDAIYRPVVVCGPSGVGKGTLIKLMKETFPEQFSPSVSHTTRKPREGCKRKQWE